MKVGIISIGDELMNGFTVDTNSSWISRKILAYELLDVVSKITVKDSKDDIKSSLDTLISSNIDYIFITGGLGPTHDDITRDTLSEYFDSELVTDEIYYNKLVQFFKAKNRKSEHLKSQAQILENSYPIPNRYGTALGMKIDYKKTQIFVLPGVPQEVKGMMSKEILPTYFESNFAKEEKYTTLLTSGIYESQLFEILKKTIIENKNYFKISFLPSYAGVKIRLSSEKKNKSLTEFKIKVLDLIQDYVYGFDMDKIEEIIAKKLIKEEMTIAIAESCTGGSISKKLTDVAGSSKYLKGSIIAYSNNIKENFLNVKSDILLEKGAVSSEVACMMAENIRKKFNVDIGVSTTGISGPTGGSKEKPVGLIYIAISTKKEKIVKKSIFKLERKEHRKVATYKALSMINSLVNNKK